LTPSAKRLLQHYLPKADVVPPVRTFAIGLLERELFLFALVVKWTDRRIVVWPVERHAADDVNTRSQSDRICGIPAGSVHGAEDIVPAADESDIKRISGYAVSGTRHHGQGRKARLVLVMAPQRGQQQVGKQKISEEQARKNDPPSSPTFNLLHALPLWLIAMAVFCSVTFAPCATCKRPLPDVDLVNYLSGNSSESSARNCQLGVPVG
jgi:hypothetical protein